MDTKDKFDRGDFIMAYKVCALWSSTDVVNGKDVELDKYELTDIDPATVAQMEKDCNLFMDGNAADLAGITAEQAGHDFWLTRNGHGAGFWDRGLEEVGDRLTAACKTYGNMDLYLGDDKRIYH